MSLLEELDYTLQLPTDQVIQSRQDVVITSPAPTHNYGANSTIRLVMNGSGFLDPRTVQLYGDVYFIATNAGSLAGAVPATYQLFDSIRLISGSGEVLEDINQAGLLATLLHSASSSSSYLDCSGGFSNSQKDPTKRKAPSTEADAIRFRLGITDIIGLFNQTKLLHLPTFKGLTLEMRMAAPSTVGAFENVNASAGFNYFLKNVKVHYTEVQATQNYLDAYNSKVRSGGYAIAYPTYTHLSNNVSSGGNSQLALGKTASRCKSIVSSLRIAGDRSLAHKNSYATSAKVKSYQYQIGGQNYPPQAVDSHSQAFHEMLRANNNTKDNRYSNVCYDEWTEPWSWAQKQRGCFAMWIDLEKSQSSNLSGTKIDASSNFLKVNQEEGTPTVIDSFVCFDRLLSITEGRVSYMD